MTRAAFYCMSSDVYFLGAVGMINSLRLQGHTEPIYLLDLGLGEEQRGLLAAEVTIVPAPEGVEPWLAKTITPLAHPAETMVLIDADLVLTRPLGELIDSAGEGRVVAFENEVDRFVPEWADLLELGELRRRPYIGSGLVLCGGETGAEVLRLVDERQRRVEFDRAFFAADEPGYALRFLDQDVLNAVLARSSYDPAACVALPYRLAPSMPPYEGLRIADLEGVRCVYEDGVEPYAVHHILPDKPWRRPMYDAVYSRLLKRLLVGDGLAIRVPERMVPLRMRRGPLAFAERKRVDAMVRFRWHAGIALHRIRARAGSAAR